MELITVYDIALKTRHAVRVLAAALCLGMLLLALPFGAAADTALPAPANLRLASKTTASIQMAWDAVPGASYYRFYLNGSFLTSVTGATYNSTGLSPDTVYGFKVAAVDSDGTLGAYSSNVYIRTEAQLAAPQNLHAAYTGVDSITMAWNGVSGADYYRFYRNGSFLTAVYGTSLENTGLTRDTVYGFKVAAVSGSGSLGLYSGNVYIRTDAQLAAPQNLHETDKNTVSIVMQWDAVPGASYYRFYQNGSFLTTVYGTAYTSTGLSADTVYGFKVAAVESGGTLGAYSGNVYIRTGAAPDAPQNLRSAGATSGSIQMEWDAVTGASYYRFYQNGSFLTTVYGTAYTSTGLSADTVYGFKVAAVDSGGTLGAYSSNVYVRTLQAQLPAPQNLRSAEATSSSIQMEWDAVPGASY
ncbi:MAG: hypothetical protein PHO41_11020, partial [Eubacteriales bacterium]|nr:hypothetical protein [Eubacteriales bacterium]